MVQVLPKFDPYGDIGAALGSGFSQGINQGIERNFKKKDEQSKADELKKIISGFTPEQQQDPFFVLGALAKYPEQAKYALEFQKENRKQKSEQQLTKETGNIVGKHFANLGEKSTLEDVNKAYVNALQEGADPTILGNVIKQYEPVIKNRLENQQAKDVIQNLRNRTTNVQSNEVPKEMKIGDLPSEYLEQTKSNDYTPSEIVELVSHPNKLVSKYGEALQKEREFDQTAFNSLRKYESEFSKPFLAEIDKGRKSLRRKEAALADIDYGFETGNFGFLSKDNLADWLGPLGEGLVTPEGAIVRTGLKEFLFSTVGQLGGRPNQWIEQQVQRMLTDFGRSDQANDMTRVALRNEINLEKDRIQITDKLVEKYKKEKGIIPGNIGSLVDKEIDKNADKIKNKYAYELRKVYEKYKTNNELLKDIDKKVVKGTPLTFRTARLLKEKYKSVEKAQEVAEKLGYTIPTKDEIREYTNGK